MRERLSYANVMSTILVFGVLGGGAYATAELDKNEVKSKHIKAGAVKSSELAGDAVTSPKVANGKLVAEDVAAGQAPAGPPGTARAYGTIEPASCVLANPPYQSCTAVRAKGIGGITRFFAGQYCVTVPGIDSRQVPAVVSVDNDSTAGFDGNASVTVGPSDGNALCPVAGAYHVRSARQLPVTVDKGGGTNNETVSDEAVSVQDVGFTIVVP